jgi:hypothetical protein
MASVATLSVYSIDHRLGTVYLACAPEENQETLSRNLTSLLKSNIQSRGSILSRTVYVSDAGKIETADWMYFASAFGLRTNQDTANCRLLSGQPATDDDRRCTADIFATHSKAEASSQVASGSWGRVCDPSPAWSNSRVSFLPAGKTCKQRNITSILTRDS